MALNSDGTMTGWNPAPMGDVHALEARGGTLYVGGQFSEIAGQPRSGLAAFSGGTLTAWAPQLDQPHVRALETSGTRLYVSGQFTAVGGTPRSRLAAFSLAGGSLDADWAPPAQDAFEQLTYADANDTLYLSGNYVDLGGWRQVHARDGTTGEIRFAPQTTGRTQVAIEGSTLYLAARRYIPNTSRP